MKRSEINAQLRLAKELLDQYCFVLPQWGYWSPEDWKHVGLRAREIRECMLGWDITDFGAGKFAECGLILFTLRNGNLKNSANIKSYAEKIMVVQVNQVTPMHFHWAKMEDIINRNGGELVIQLYHADANEILDLSTPVQVSIDGIERSVAAGDCVRLKPGESITLPPRLYHKFWAEGAPCVVGEVSKVNDDTCDNRFADSLGRFPAIDEDEPPLHLLCNEYPK